VRDVKWLSVEWVVCSFNIPQLLPLKGGLTKNNVPTFKEEGPMKHFFFILLIGVLCLSIGLVAVAAGKGPKKSGKDLKSMSQEEQIKLALSAAPTSIAKEAGVMFLGEDGKLMEVKKSANGFNCLPALENDPEPDPICFDAAVGQFIESFLSKAEKPSNTVPGVAYMAHGGYHWERDGKVLMEKEPGAKRVKEPPHWMIMWPFKSEDTKLPNRPNPSGAWVMFDGTPYAHLMIYQDPNKMKAK